MPSLATEDRDLWRNYFANRTPNGRLANIAKRFADPALDEQRLNCIAYELQNLKKEVEALPNSRQKLLLLAQIDVEENKINELNNVPIPMSVDPIL